ncbi:MAG: Glutathione S-transferase family protein, partial [uncultured Paraburkholderia sp.]
MGCALGYLDFRMPDLNWHELRDFGDGDQAVLATVISLEGGVARAMDYMVKVIMIRMRRTA